MSTDLGVDPHDHRISPPVTSDTEIDRGRCGTCRWWRQISGTRWGQCSNGLAIDRDDPAFQGIFSESPHPSLVGDRFGCVHWSGEPCPTCREPRRASCS